MKHTRHARRYARMFLGATGPEGARKGLEELAIAAAAIEKSPEFRHLLASPAFSAEDRATGLDAVASLMGFSQVTVQFLRFLAGQSDALALGDVLDRAVAMYAEQAGRVSATVVAPVALGPEYDARIKAALGKLTGREVDVAYEVDPSLLGGVLVKVGSTMFDGSIKGQLRLLKDELIKG